MCGVPCRRAPFHALPPKGSMWLLPWPAKCPREWGEMLCRRGTVDKYRCYWTRTAKSSRELIPGGKHKSSARRKQQGPARLGRVVGMHAVHARTAPFIMPVGARLGCFGLQTRRADYSRGKNWRMENWRNFYNKLNLRVDFGSVHKRFKGDLR